jgi:methionyl-tRNA formyltransferase
MKTIFLGTPALAVPFLDCLAKKTEVQAVITAPDQPAGRGYQLKAPEVKVAAQKLALPILQPETLKDVQVAEKIRALGAEVGIVVAYGKLLPEEVLAIPKHGFLNVHFSLLPKYRGAAPIQWALVNGETETGVTLFWLDEGMDTGPVFLQKKIAIQPEDDAESLRNKLVELGVTSLEQALEVLEKGRPKREPQKGVTSKAPILKKEDGRIDWAKPAEAIHNQLRGFAPWPGAYVQGLKIVEAKVSFDSEKAAPGTVIRLVSGEGPVVKCGSNSLVLLQVQPEGKKAMPAWSWWQGARLKLGETLR